MLPIVDKPTIQFIVEEAVASGIEDIIIVTGRSKRAIEDHFDKSVELEEDLKKNKKEELLAQVQAVSNLVNIHYIRQKEPKGLGHAIYCAKTFIGNEPFAVLLGDDIVKSETPCLKQLIQIYDQCKTSVLGVQRVPGSEVSKYGIVAGEKVGERVYRVNDMIEKPEPEQAPSDIAILGRYIISPAIFKHLENTKPGKNGEIQLTDALKELMKDEALHAYDFIGKRYDVGNKIGFLQANVEFALERDDLKDEFKAWLKQIIKG
jgi:UTP--glucose-1-phosphate uridylyltransferase